MEKENKRNYWKAEEENLPINGRIKLNVINGCIRVVTTYSVKCFI